MATRRPPTVPLGDEAGDAALQQPLWRNRLALSSVAGFAEGFLERAGFDRAPWLAIALAAGIACWFVAPSPAWWIGAIAAGLLAATGALAAWRGRDDRSRLIHAGVALGALSMALITLMPASRWGWSSPLAWR